MIKANDIMYRRHSKFACTSTTTITYSYNEYDSFRKDANEFGVTLAFPGIYKEISMVKAVDIHTAIGNAGGYIGIFLGNMTFAP